MTGAVTGALLTVSQPVQAYSFLGCKLHSPGYIRYGNHAYTTATSNGASAWTATPTKISLWQYASSPWDVEFYKADFGNVSWAGQTWWSCTNGWFDADSLVYYNTYYTSAYSTAKRQEVAVHELGHVVGLNHAGTSSCAGQPIMYPDTHVVYDVCGHNKPQQDDINGVNALYGYP